MKLIFLVVYFLHLKTLDILLLIVNISIANYVFYKYIFLIFVILHEKLYFQQFVVVVKTTERRKNQSFTLLFIYFITVNKYRFCISVIGYINIQIIGIGYKKINIGRSLIKTNPDIPNRNTFNHCISHTDLSLFL